MLISVAFNNKGINNKVCKSPLYNFKCVMVFLENHEPFIASQCTELTSSFQQLVSSNWVVVG